MFNQILCYWTVACTSVEAFSLALALWATLLCHQWMQRPPSPTWSSTYAIASVCVITFLSLLIEPKSPLQPGGQARSCSLLVLKTSEEWSLFWLLALVLRARGLQPLHLHRRKWLPSMASGCCQQGPNPTYPSPLTPAACFRAHCLLSGIVFNARALLGTRSMVPYPLISPPLHGSPITHQKSDFPRKLEEPCWLLSSVQLWCPGRALLLRMLGLTCLHGTGLMEEQTPPSRATQMKASEPINRAISQTIFKITIALYCSNQYAQYMLNVYEYTLLFLFFENVRSIFFFLISVKL